MRCTFLNYSETAIFPQNQQSKETMRWFVVIFFQSHTNYFQNWIFTPSAKKLLLFLIFTEFTLSRVRWHGWAPQQQTLLGLAKDCLCWCIRDVDDDELLLRFAISTKFKHHSVLPVAIRFFTLFLSPIVCNCIISALETSCHLDTFWTINMHFSWIIFVTWIFPQKLAEIKCNHPRGTFKDVTIRLEDLIQCNTITRTDVRTFATSARFELDLCRNASQTASGSIALEIARVKYPIQAYGKYQVKLQPLFWYLRHPK